MISGRDVLVLLKTASAGPMPVRALGAELGMSKSSVDASIQRLKRARLITPDGRISRLAFLEFAQHAVRYLFPAVPGKIVLGVPTAHAFGPIAAQLSSSDPLPTVMPLDEAEVRGRSVDPIHPSAPALASSDPELHALLACVDTFRIGRARERKLAARELSLLISSGLVPPEQTYEPTPG